MSAFQGLSGKMHTWHGQHCSWAAHSQSQKEACQGMESLHGAKPPSRNNPGRCIWLGKAPRPVPPVTCIGVYYLSGRGSTQSCKAWASGDLLNSPIMTGAYLQLYAKLFWVGHMLWAHFYLWIGCCDVLVILALRARSAGRCCDV